LFISFFVLFCIIFLPSLFYFFLPFFLSFFLFFLSSKNQNLSILSQFQFRMCKNFTWWKVVTWLNSLGPPLTLDTKVFYQVVPADKMWTVPNPLPLFDLLMEVVSRRQIFVTEDNQCYGCTNLPKSAQEKEETQGSSSTTPRPTQECKITNFEPPKYAQNARKGSKTTCCDGEISTAVCVSSRWQASIRCGLQTLWTQKSPNVGPPAARLHNHHFFRFFGAKVARFRRVESIARVPPWPWRHQSIILVFPLPAFVNLFIIVDFVQVLYESWIFLQFGMKIDFRIIYLKKYCRITVAYCKFRFCHSVLLIYSLARKLYN